MMGNLYMKAAPPVELNRNPDRFRYPGVWTAYILILLFSWILILYVSGCSLETTWTIVNLLHFAVTYYFFHWKKGTPFANHEGIYNCLTWWEQVDNGDQFTPDRKFLTLVPLILYLFVLGTTDYNNPIMLFFNTVAMLMLVVAKFPHMHRVQIFTKDA